MQMPYMDQQQRQDAKNRKRGPRGATRNHIYRRHAIGSALVCIAMGLLLGWLLSHGI